jgi:hypothetical protein
MVAPFAMSRGQESARASLLLFAQSGSDGVNPCTYGFTEMKTPAYVAVFGVVLAGCGGNSPDTSNTVEHAATIIDAHIDCGKGKSGSEYALRRFTAALRRGNRSEIRSVLTDRPRFFAISARGHPGPNVSVRGDPGAAARAIAKHGGLPVTITQFMNSEAPSRTTDLSFKGRWNGARHMFGKAAIDCTEGKVITFNIAVHAR